MAGQAKEKSGEGAGAGVTRREVLLLLLLLLLQASVGAGALAGVASSHPSSCLVGEALAEASPTAGEGDEAKARRKR